MAKKVSENDILNMSYDWSCDPTNDLPYSGRAVQKFIKDKLNTKAGIFYNDFVNNRYLVFADEETKDLYLQDTSKTDLIIGAFDAPFNYEAIISLKTPQYNVIFVNSTGNYLDFTFDIKNKQGDSTGENVVITYTFIRNSYKKVVTETRRYGETVHFNMDDYLLEGLNTIIINVSGSTTFATTTVALTYQVINLQYKDELNISKVYDLSKQPYVLEVHFEISGYGTKIVEWFLDGVLLNFVKSEDEVIDVTAYRTKYIELRDLQSGIHTILSRAYTLVNGEKFYTDTLYREIIVNNRDTSDNTIAIAANIPNSHGIITTTNPLVFYGAELYIPYEIKFATRKTGDVKISLNNNLLTTITSATNVELYYNIVSNTAGILNIELNVDNTKREIPLKVSETSLNVEEISTGLLFNFNAAGKNNNSTDKDEWSYGEYEATFEGFNWNISSGWVNNALLINEGASFSVNIKPFEKDITSTGASFEFEFSTSNVENDDAIICDLTTDGKGLLITASEARLTSAAGETVNTRFKSGDINRITFVVNRKTGTIYKGLVFIYVNGILSGAMNYGSADNFISNKSLVFSGTEQAQVALRSLRFYNTALSSDNVLNNYILYRDNINEMMEVYYRNDIYAEGTQTFAPETMLRRLPVMVITGDIPALEEATSTSTQILVDIDYQNLQDPNKNFKIKNAALRIQGTSSLAYPRKNFRFYTQKEESTILYDSLGNVVQDKLYSFKDGAQPVNCWCLKADFAESSGTHNTGIARIWNDVMYNAIIQHTNVLGESVDDYVLRTSAQTAALNANYEYDVRTTIDGFPIVLFYKTKDNDTDLIFLGKYNFNNDKSTPSVFGFENIPNFDNSRMQCWETKDNGHPLGLFTDISEFDQKWSEAFESRYPETTSPNTSDLKAFSLWINAVDQTDFVTQKWQHLDVYKVAAYYCYLMRFGAVDQPVKNAFLTSEDGEKFFFINYDNDTINGLINTGKLLLDPDVNRDTIGSDGEYVYAGHDSVLWNRLVNDAEFMEIVSIVDNAIYSAGLRYDSVIAEFNENQSDKWVERVYNQDAEYKYILPYINMATNNLFMLQGSRYSHRSWWLSKRFALYDSLFLSGAYRDRNISFKCMNNTQPGQEFTITAATKMNYGYGVNNGMRLTGIEINKNGTHTFTTTDTLNLGDVVKIFASSNIDTLDLSKLADRLVVLDCSSAADPQLGTKMKRLLLGGSDKINTELSSISGINALNSLQELNIEGYENITSLDLTAQPYLRKLYAKGSSIASIDFIAGSPVDTLELPSTMMSLDFNQLPYLTIDGLRFERNLANVHTLNIFGCPNLTNSYTFVRKWLNEKVTDDLSCKLAMDNVDWTMSYDEFMSFSQRKVAGMQIELKGKVYISSIDVDKANAIEAIWGNEVFDKRADFRVTAPDALYINPTEITINEGESVEFSHILFSDTNGTIEYKIVQNDRDGVTIDANTGVLTTTENGLSDSTLLVRVVYTSDKGNAIYALSTVTIKKRKYPSASSISIYGSAVVTKDETYTLIINDNDVNGSMKAEWSFSGDATNGYLFIGKNDNNSCVIKFLKPAELGQSITGTLTVTLKKNIDNSVIAVRDLIIKVGVLYYPTDLDTTIIGNGNLEGDNPTYTWLSTVQGELGPMSVKWQLSEELSPYYEIASEEWDLSDPLHGSVTLSKIKDVEGLFVNGDIRVIITRLNTGENTVISKTLSLINPNVIMTEYTNPAVMSVMYNSGFAKNSTHMTKLEAAAVTDGSFNPTGSIDGSIFHAKINIENFDELQYFTGMTKLDDYCFNGCINLRSIKFPDTISSFGKSCLLRTSSARLLIIDRIKVTHVETTAFMSASDFENNGDIIINTIDWYCEDICSNDRTRMFRDTTINTLNVYNSTAGYNSSSPDYLHFADANIKNIIIHDSMSSVPDYLFVGAYLGLLELSDNVTNIGTYAFWQMSSKDFYVNKIGTNIENIGIKGFHYPIFTVDVYFNKLDLSKDLIKISDAYYQLKLDVSNAETSTNTYFYITDILSNLIHCEHLLLPENTVSYQNTGTINAGKVKNVYIPNIINYCNSSHSGTSVASLAQNLYTRDINTGDYISIENFKPSDFLIQNINNNAFRYCNALKEIDITGINKVSNLVFYESGISKIILDSINVEVGQLCFCSCKNLKTIVDIASPSNKKCKIYYSAFSNVPYTVEINSLIFGLFYHQVGTGLYFMKESDSMATTVYDSTIFLFSFDEYNVSIGSDNDFYFENLVRNKTIQLLATGTVEDLSEQLKIHFVLLNIQSNKNDAMFNISYVDINGQQKNETIPIGVVYVNASISALVQIEPITTYTGYDTPNAINHTLHPSINDINFTYKELQSILIAHKNGELYTTEQWTDGEYSNDDAEGVCIMRYDSHPIIIAKKDLSEKYAFGGTDFPTEMDVADKWKSYNYFKEGIKNTQKIIKNYTGYTSNNITGAPAAEACVAYTFPSGANGYLLSMEEWDCIFNQYSEFLNAINLIGGSSFKSDSYYTSNIYDKTNAWCVNTSSKDFSAYYKATPYYCRPASSYILYINVPINSNATFKLEYTDNHNRSITKLVTAGMIELNIKVGTAITVTPIELNLINGDAKVFIWTGFYNQIDFSFSKDSGIYILHRNGNLYTESEWQSGENANSDANGVAIISDVHSFVLSKNNHDTSKYKFFKKDYTPTPLLDYNTLNSAILKYSCEEDTKTLINKYDENTAPAVHAVNRYVFPNGKHGHLPSVFELILMFNNLSQINTMLLCIGEQQIISDGYYWTGVEVDSYNMWNVNMKDGRANKTTRKNNALRTYPVMSF